MSDNTRYRFVNFAYWCPKCKYGEQDEKMDPCNDCLNFGGNVETSQPVEFVKKKDLDESKVGETKNAQNN